MALTKVGDAVIDLHARAEGISKSISDAIENGGESGGSKIKSSLGKAMGTVAKIGGAAVAGAATAVATGVAAITKQAVSSYAEYEQLAGGVETLFGSAADMVEGMADKAYKSAGLTKNAYMETVNGMAAALNQATGNVAESAKMADMAVIDMADNANKMGTSMESIQNAYAGFTKQNFTMLDNLKLGYGGTKDEMKRLLEDAQAISGVEYDISSYADIVSAIHVIQEEMGIAGTTTKEATETISGSLSMVQGAWGNLLAGLANDDANIGNLLGNLLDSVFGTGGSKGLLDNLLPRISSAFDGIVDFVGKAIPQLFDKIVPVAEQYLPNFINGLFSIAEVILNNAPMLLTLAGTITTTMLDALTQNLPKLLEIVPDLFTRLINVASTQFTNILTSVLTLITTLVNFFLEDGLPLIIDCLPDIISAVVTFILGASTMITDAVLQILLAVINMAPDIAIKLAETLPYIVSELVTAIGSHAPELSQAVLDLTIATLLILPAVILEIVEHIPEIFTAIVNGFKEEWPTMKEAGYDAFDQAILGMFSDTIYGEMVDGIAKFIAESVNNIKSFAEDFKSAGEDIMQGLINGIGNKIQEAKDKIAELGNGIAGHFRNIMSIGSPSRLFEQFGEYIDEGLINGITGGTNDVINASGQLGNAVVGGFNPGTLTAGYRQGALAGGGDIIIPVYIGQKKFGTAVVEAIDIQNYISGGR